MKLSRWFKKVDSVKPSEQAIAKPVINFPTYEEVSAMVESLSEHYDKHVNINIEINCHSIGLKKAEMKYWLYIADKSHDYFETFEALRLFVSKLS